MRTLKLREVKNPVPKSTQCSRLELESRGESRSIGVNPFLVCAPRKEGVKGGVDVRLWLGFPGI